MQYYDFCAKLEGTEVLPTACSGFAPCCKQAPGLGCTETKLLLMVLQSGAGVSVVCRYTHAHTTLLWEDRYVSRGTQQATPAVTFYLLK